MLEGFTIVIEGRLPGPGLAATAAAISRICR
jgi:hypothetical protein